MPDFQGHMLVTPPVECPNSAECKTYLLDLDEAVTAGGGGALGYIRMATSIGSEVVDAADIYAPIKRPERCGSCVINCALGVLSLETQTPR